MRTRKLGWTDLELTTIGMGTWAIGGGEWEYGWGPQDDEDSIAAIRRAIESGVNWIDTAAAYGLGHAEEIVARAIAPLNPRPIIATKCGLVWDEKRHVINHLARASVTAEIEASLKRLKMDTIDLYQIHWPSPDSDIEQAWEAIMAAVKQGKIRYAAVSNFNVDQLKRVGAIAPVASLQPYYSMLGKRIENEILPYCKQHNIGVVAYSPMHKGILTGKWSVERSKNLPESDHRGRDREFKEPRLSANLELAASLQSMAQKHGRSAAHLAVAWVLRRSEMTSAIVGGRNAAQVEDILAGADWVLSEAEIAEIDSLLALRDKKLAKI